MAKKIREQIKLNETNKKCELSVYEQPMVNGALLLAGIEVK